MKVIVLSIDAARPDILESQVKLGNMPSLEGMLDRCFMFKQCETTYPPATATALEVLTIMGGKVLIVIRRVRAIHPELNVG